MANEVATAARITLAGGTARVRHGWFFHPPEPRLERFVATQEGVTDLARRRTRTELEGPAVIDEWGARLLARFPWLDDDEQVTDKHEPSPAATIYAGTGTFFTVGGQWKAGDDGPPGPMDPLWIVEVMAHADEAVARGEDVVRNARCRRWEFRLDPARHPQLDRRAGRRQRTLRLAGDAWIDDEGRLRRVSWTRLPRRRPRSPSSKSAGPRAWQTTEFWDFGVPVDIELPTVEPEQPTPWPIGLIKLTRKLWRRRRAYARRHRPG